MVEPQDKKVAGNSLRIADRRSGPPGGILNPRAFASLAGIGIKKEKTARCRVRFSLFGPPGGIRTPGLWNRNRISGIPQRTTKDRGIPRKALYSCGFRRFSAHNFWPTRSPPEKRVFQKVLEKILEVFARGSPSLYFSPFMKTFQTCYAVNLSIIFIDI